MENEVQALPVQEQENRQESIVIPEKYSRRALALDALRGFAILTMFLSGRVPFGVLPNWMYHAQVPPPFHKFIDTLPGISWVDLVFPFFLFSMGAAIPLAANRRMEDGTPKWKLYLGMAERGLLLVGFAIYDMHMRPYALNPEPTAATWLTSLLGFALLFPVLGRMPAKWNAAVRYSIKAAGWAGVILFLYFASYPETNAHGTGFSLYRSDIIILVLANVAFTGSIIWAVTRSNQMLRLGVLGFLIAIRLSHLEPGWVKVLWDNSPAKWMGILYFQQYLFIIIPGTIAGDFLLKWMKSPKEDSTTLKSSPLKLIAAALLMIAFVLVLLTGMMSRLVVETTLLSGLMCIAGYYLLRKPLNETEKLYKTIFQWGVYWLLLGLVFEPFEGGIKKDHPTMSYYFVTTGLASFALIAFSVIIDVFKRRWLNLLVANGQNPMVAYAGITNLLPPLLALTTLGPWMNSLTPDPWMGVLRALFETLLLGYIVSLFTRMKVFLRT